MLPSERNEGFLTPRHCALAGCLAGLVALVWPTALAVAAGRGASLSGTISAPDGARLPAAVVTLTRHTDSAPDGGVTSAASVGALSAVSGSQGAFRLAGIPPGGYDLTVELEGFATRRIPDLQLADGAARRFDVRLDLATVRETLEVMTSGPDETVEAQTLRECPARDVAEVLDDVPGVGRTRRGLIGSDVTVRGFRGQDVTVLIDGQRVCGACPSRMDPPAFHVDLGEVERIEVLRGPFDVKNGGGLGGAINVVTRRPPPGWHVQPTLVLGSSGYINPVVAGSFGGHHTSALAGASYREAQPYADGTGRAATRLASYREGAATPDAFRIATAWGRVVRHNDEGLLQLAYTHQQADHILYPTLLMDAVTDDTDRLQLTWERVKSKVSAGVTRVSHWMTDAYRSSAIGTPRGYSMGTRAETHTFGLRGERQIRAFTLGLEAGRRQWDAETETAGRDYVPQASLADATADTLALFGEWEHDFTVAQALSAGLRLEHAATRVDAVPGNSDLHFAYHGTRDTAESDLLPAARLRYDWRPRAGLRLTLTAGHAARLPEANERYLALRRAGTDWVGNPSLRPSRNTGLDVTARGESARLRLDASLFADAVTDFIAVVARDRQEAAAGVINAHARSYANVDVTQVGGEARASLLLPARLFLDAEASYVRAHQEVDPARGLTSDAAAEIPPLTAHAALRYDDGRRWLRLEAVAAARQTRVNADLGEQETPGYGILNATAGLRLRRFVVTAGVVNLLDNAYAEHLSSQRDPFRSGVRLLEPGRQLFVNVIVPF